MAMREYQYYEFHVIDRHGAPINLPVACERNAAHAGEVVTHHPAALRCRAAFSAFPRNSAINTGPSENSPALAFAVRTRR